MQLCALLSFPNRLAPPKGIITGICHFLDNYYKHLKSLSQISILGMKFDDKIDVS